MVAYSQLAESGRTLYACAARHWFAADALLDKVHNHTSTLQRYAEQLALGADPTPFGWQRRLDHAALIDDIVAEPYWVQIWRALHESAGEMQATARLLGRDAAQLRGFKDRAMAAVVEFNLVIHDIEPPLVQRNKKGVLSDLRRAALAVPRRAGPVDGDGRERPDQANAVKPYGRRSR